MGVRAPGFKRTGASAPQGEKASPCLGVDVDLEAVTKLLTWKVMISPAPKHKASLPQMITIKDSL